MAVSVDKDERFTGGDNLKELNKLYHETMMRNELKGGTGAYQVSYATGKSGISFGGNQMDLSKSRKAIVDAFVDILQNAKNSNGRLIFTEVEITKIVGNENKNITQPKKTPESIFGEYLPRVNQALVSNYGYAKINSLYVSEIERGAKHVETVIQLMKNPAAKEFYDSNLGRVLLLDYHNQYHIDLDGRFLKDYINGDGKENFSTKKKIFSPQDKYTIKHHIDYIRSTEQYYNLPNDCQRRVNNILGVMQEFDSISEAVLKQAKAAWEAPFLPQSIAETVPPLEKTFHHFAFTFDTKQNRWKIFPGVEMPKIPRIEGKTSLMSIAYDYFLLPKNNTDTTFKQNFFYYNEQLQQLMHVKGLDSHIPGPRYDKWETHSVGLSPKDPPPAMSLPGSINPANYTLYFINFKKGPTDLNTLLKWLGDAIIVEEAIKIQSTNEIKTQKGVAESLKIMDNLQKASSFGEKENDDSSIQKLLGKLPEVIKLADVLSFESDELFFPAPKKETTTTPATGLDLPKAETPAIESAKADIFSFVTPI